MASQQMYKCEAKTLFKIDGKREWRWVKKPVSAIPASGAQDDVRCLHCHGRVRVHKQKVEDGPADHVEHQRRSDSEHCLGGHYFKGVHRMSDDPVE